MEGCPSSIKNCDDFSHQWSTKICNVVKCGTSTVSIFKTVKDFISRSLLILVDLFDHCQRGFIELLVDVVVHIM